MLTELLIQGAVSSLLGEFVAWQQKRARDAAWKPSPQDVTDFIKEIDNDTPDKILAEAAVETGLPIPPAPAAPPTLPTNG